MPSFPIRFLRSRAPAAGRARERWGQATDESAPVTGSVLTTSDELLYAGDRSDAELLRLARAGNIEAFRMVYGRHAAALVVASQEMGDRVRATDVGRDAFLALWRSTASYYPESETVGDWMIRVTRQTADEVVRVQPSEPEREQSSDNPGAA